MIKIISNEVNEFIKYLNEKYKTEKDVYMHIIENCDVVKNPQTGTTAYGAYVSSPNGDYNHIYIAGLCDEVLWTIAHEYKHHLQKYNEQVDFSEEDADNFADKVVNDFMEN